MYERIRNHITKNGMNPGFVENRMGTREKRFFRMVNGRKPLLVDEYEILCRKGLQISPCYFFEEHSLSNNEKQ